MVVVTVEEYERLCQAEKDDQRGLQLVTQPDTQRSGKSYVGFPPESGIAKSGESDISI